MKYIAYTALILTLILSPCWAVRFHPENDDATLLDLAKQYQGIGMVHEQLITDYEGEKLAYSVKSTATLVTLPKWKQFDGKLLLVSHHAFQDWQPNSDNYTFHHGCNVAKVIQYVPAPEITLSKSFWYLWTRSVPLQCDYGFALLDQKFDDTQLSPLDLSHFEQIPENTILTSIGCGDAGRLDSPYYFHDNQPRGMQAYASEYRVSSAKHGIQTIHNGEPLRLEYWYHWDREHKMRERIIRGSCENQDSGGPVFRNGQIIGLMKGSIIQFNMPDHSSQFFTSDPKAIEYLKSNQKLTDDLQSDHHANSLGQVIECLAGNRDWILHKLPQLLQQ